MIQRFIEVIPGKLFRGGAPNPEDVFLLKEKYNINKIISLDPISAEKIERACKMLNIEHAIIPLRWNQIKQDLMNLFEYDLKELLLDNNPTFIHCAAGKDRTGLIIALFKIKYMDEDPNNALNEANKLGFGIGMNKKNLDLFKKLILSCKKDNKQKYNSIVSNQRDYKSDNRDTFLDEARQESFAPHLDSSKQYPYDVIYNSINDQSNTRENYKKENNEEYLPIVGLFNNDAGVRGFGPVENAGGFIYD